MEFVYKIENEIKQEYLNSKTTLTAKSEAFILRSADEYESLIGKSIYNMTYSELREMIGMQFSNSSLKTILKNISILKTYVDFCIYKNLVLHGENRFSAFTTEESKKLVHRQALLNKYTPKKQIREYQNILYNDQDKLFLELSYLGVKGRPTKDGTLEEIINLTIDDVDEEKKQITLTQNDGTHRILKVETHTIELIKDVFKQKFYLENNGELTDNPRTEYKPREIQINKVENYVFRVPGMKKVEIFTPNLLNSRMRRIQKYVGNMYITFSSLYQSGMVEKALDIYKEKNEVTKEDYIRICVEYNYGSEKNEYWHVLKSLVEQYIEVLL